MSPRSPSGAFIGKLKLGQQAPASLRSYSLTVAVVLVSTSLCGLMFRYFDQANLIMIYLFGVAYVSLTFGTREAILASVLSVLAFDLVYTEPRGRVNVSDWQYVVTLAIMLAVSVLISGLVKRLRAEAIATAEREMRTAALYRLTKELARVREPLELAVVAQREIRTVFAADVAVFISQEGDLLPSAASLTQFETRSADLEAISWAVTNEEVAGHGTAAHGKAAGLYLPLRGSRTVGLLAFCPGEEQGELDQPQRDLLETFANGIGVALERAQLAKESEQATLQAEGQKARNALLASISHDLRTPLASIAGAASALTEGRGNAPILASTIYSESIRLNRQIQNLLDMTRLQSGKIQLNQAWNSLEEVVGIAIARGEQLLAGREVRVNVPGDLPFLNVDGDLIEKTIVNLLENAARHTPPSTAIEIAAGTDEEIVWLAVIDEGLGIPVGQERRICEPFVQLKGDSGGQGVGLGLAVCQTVMNLHGGELRASNRSDRNGAEFRIEFPKPAIQPEVPIG